MKDEHWKYLLEVSFRSGDDEHALRFSRKSYANDLIVPFYEMLNLDPNGFGKSDSSPRLSGLQIEGAKLLHQPTDEIIAIIRHYPKGGKYFFGGTGLYIETFVPVETIEKIMDISLEGLDRDKLPGGFLRLGTYNFKKSQDIIPQDAVVDITENMINSRFDKGIGVFNLDLYHRRFNSYAGPDISYSFNTLKEAILALTEQDLTPIVKPPGISTDPTVRTIQISRIAEPLVDIERHPPFLASPVTGVPGIFYTVPDKDTLAEIQQSVDLFVLPHFEKGKHYFQVAYYNSATDVTTEPVPALEILRQQLSGSNQPELHTEKQSYRVDFHYQVAKKGQQQTVSTSFENVRKAVKALTAITPDAFEAKNIKRGQNYLERADLVHVPDGKVMASMFKTTAATNGRPGGIYIMVDQAQLTTSLADAILPILNQYVHGSNQHLLLAKAGELATTMQKHSGKPRILADRKGSGQHL